MDKGLNSKKVWIEMVSQTTFRSNSGERTTRYSRKTLSRICTAQTIPLLILCLNGCFCNLTLSNLLAFVVQLQTGLYCTHLPAAFIGDGY